MEKINLLWTGGWDSTYRLIELSLKKVIIQPYYLYGDNRKSENNEKKSMDVILHILRNKKNTLAIINDIVYVNINDFKFDKEVHEAYNNLYKKTKLGTQYEWLAIFAKSLENGLELAIEKTPVDKVVGCHATIRRFGKLKKINGISRYKLDEKNSTNDCTILLKNFLFPIIDKTELDMFEEIKRMDYQDVMKNIWFCHTPIRGKPCGFCNPCQEKIDSNMEYLLPRKAIKNNNLKRFCLKHFNKRIAGKICGFYRKIILMDYN